MDISVIIPAGYYSLGVEERVRNLTACLEGFRTQRNNGEFSHQVIVVELGEKQSLPLADNHIFFRNPPPHNRSLALDIGAKLFPAPLLVFSASDFLPDKTFLCRMFAAWKSGGEYILPWSEPRHLSEEETVGIIGREVEFQPGNPDYERLNDVGLVWGMDGGAYWKIGGHNRLFVGYGQEDRDVMVRAEKSGMKFVRCNGVARHLYHQKFTDDTMYEKENRELYRRLHGV